MNRRPHVLAICVGSCKGRKTPVDLAAFRAGHGLEGDAHAGSWHRQVSLLAAEDVETMRRSGAADLRAGDFGENLLVEGLDVSRLAPGSRLRIGAEAELEITQVGKVCHHRCAIFHAVGDCIMPTHGLFACVLRGGVVRPGEVIEILRSVAPDVCQAVVLTLSDRCSRGEALDTAGPAVARLLEQSLGAHILAEEILPDERIRLEERLRHYADERRADLITAVGGTGFAPRDVTPEAVRAVVERLTPGLDEAMRATSLRTTPHAMLSRAVSGIRGRTLILSLPGSEKAARENLGAILPALRHGLEKLRGDPMPCGEPTGPAAP